MNNNIKQFVTDGQSIVDCWMITEKEGFRRFKNTDIHLSVSNLLYAQTYYAEVLKAIAVQGEDALKEFQEDYIVLDSFLFNGSLDRYLKEFITTRNVFSDRIVIDKEQNLAIVLFKGVDIDCDSIQEVSPVIAETLGLVGFFQQRNDNIELITSFDILNDFIKEFNIKCDLKFITLN